MSAIMVVPYKEIDIHLLVTKDKVGYSFEYEGKAYGNQTDLPRKRDLLVGTVATLIVNAIVSIDYHGENSNTAVH
jgi:hypothetical protein